MKKEYNASSKCTQCEIVNCDCAQECSTSQVDENVRPSLTNKICRECKQNKTIENFYWDSWKVSYALDCKECKKKYYQKTKDRQIKNALKWNKDNRKRAYEINKKWRDKDPEKYHQYLNDQYSKHKVKRLEGQKRYRSTDEGKAIRLAANTRRELAKINATPKWLTKEQLEQLKQFYLHRPKGYHVDHIIPINGKEVCGLHVPWNLQYLPAIENIKKRNKIIS